MADDNDLRFESPVVRRYSVTVPGALTMVDLSHTVKWLVRASEVGPVADRLGVGFGSSRRASGGALVLGSRPGEWIVLGTAHEVAEVVEDVVELDSQDFVTALDWSHGRALFRITGRDAPRVLEKVCSLDTSEAMTPDGAVASASVAKVTCDIARDDAGAVPSYLILCDRSFGQYLFDALIDAGTEYGLTVSSGAGGSCLVSSQSAG